MSELRESELLSRIASESRPWPRGVIVGPGDDMALLEVDHRLLLAAVDQVVEGRHFTSGTDPVLIAHKAIGRNLSDVAAMAAKPLALLAACTLPPTWSNADANSLFDALRRISLEWECPLVGGDIAVHRGAAPLVISVTILAEPWPEAIGRMGVRNPARCVAHRHRGRVGDRVFVTGALGGSFGARGDGRHLRFEPRVHEARALAAAVGLNQLSLVDLSDGVGRDAGTLVDETLQVVIDASALPCSPGCDWRAALGDGEDYELCFAAPNAPSSLRSRSGSETPVTCIGRIRERPAPDAPACVVESLEGEFDGRRFGWEHRGHER